MKRPKFITTDFRPRAATAATSGAPTARPGAAACKHALMLEGVSDVVIAGVIEDAEKRNLRDYSDHETRWWAARSSAARLIRRQRKAAGTWTLIRTSARP